jgi:hypothetical protein
VLQVINVALDIPFPDKNPHLKGISLHLQWDIVLKAIPIGESPLQPAYKYLLLHSTF